MLELADFSEKTLAAALLREDHDLLTVEVMRDHWHSGEIEEVTTESRTPARWEMTVQYRAINNDETTAFPNGRVEAADDVTPGEHDAYCLGIVVLFDELIAGHHVILEGSHGGAGESDESHEAYMFGTITVVPESDGPEELRLALSRQRRDVMQDIAGQLDKVAKRLHDATLAEMAGHGVIEAFGGLARLVARAS